MIKILIVMRRKNHSRPAGHVPDCGGLTTAIGWWTTAWDAADAVEETRYDLILLDVMLPGSDAFELMGIWPLLNIPAFSTTARDLPQGPDQGLKLGAGRLYRSKPFEIAELLARVETGPAPVP